MALLPHAFCLSIHERRFVGNATPNWAATSLLRPRPNRDAQAFKIYASHFANTDQSPLAGSFLYARSFAC